MPQIDKVKKTKSKKLLPVVKTTKKKTKSSPVDYYNCLLLKAQNDWLDPIAGKKQKITACCKDCKTNAPILNRQRITMIKWIICLQISLFEYM
jgi:hypothetical protein